MTLTSTAPTTPTSSTDSITVSDITELHVVETSLDDLCINIHTELEIAHYKSTAPKAMDKKSSILKVGMLLLEARKQFSEDKAFGDWCKGNITEKCSTTIKKPTRQSLRRYRLLAEFCSDISEIDKKLKYCLEVGFTNVYKLMESDNSELLKHLREGSIEASDIDKKLNPEKYIKQNTKAFITMKSDVNNLTTEQAEELVKLLTETHGIES